ncbi:MAG: RluA family pseudouridine synthase [Vallitaleaceae bacterium]|nr:RluA family pseudouridine synthase [Vallitaleaceae bacterium]
MIKILFHDKDIVVAFKPVNMPSQKDFSRDPDIQSLVSEQLHTTVFLIHRLDRHVCGPMVFALNKKAAAQLSKQLEGHMFSKKYYAVVLGMKTLVEDEKKETWVSLFHRISKEKNMAIIKGLEEEGKRGDEKVFKDARLAYRVLSMKEVEGGEPLKKIALLDVDLETGRFHQIRAQLSFEKMPILGDPKYGIVAIGKSSFKEIGLMAYELQFQHPSTQERMCFHEVNLHSPFTIFAEFFQANVN